MTTATTSASSSTAASSAATATIANSKNNMGQQEFLKLLIAQLKNQNPLSPMDSTQFTAQMAQFSSLEQLTNINKSLGGLSQVTSAMNNAEAMGMIGKTIQAVGNTIDIASGSPASITFNLPSSTATTDIGIADAAGKVVATLQGGKMSVGDHTAVWDGKDAAGHLLPSGTYTYAINAADSTGAPISATTFLSGLVKSVSIINGTTMLNVGNSQINLTDVTKVAQ